VEQSVNDDIHVVVLFDVVETDEPRKIRILGEIIRGLEWHGLGGELIHVWLRELRG